MVGFTMVGQDIEQNITMSSKIGVKFSSGGFRTDFCNLLVWQLKFLFSMVGWTIADNYLHFVDSSNVLNSYDLRFHIFALSGK